MDNTTQPTPSKGGKPPYDAYHVVDRGKGQKNVWTRIGAAWPHEDGKGFNIQINVAPLDGRIALRIYEEKNKE